MIANKYNKEDVTNTMPSLLSTVLASFVSLHSVYKSLGVVFIQLYATGISRGINITIPTPANAINNLFDMTPKMGTRIPNRTEFALEIPNCEINFPNNGNSASIIKYSIIKTVIVVIPVAILCNFRLVAGLSSTNIKGSEDKAKNSGILKANFKPAKAIAVAVAGIKAKEG